MGASATREMRSRREAEKDPIEALIDNGVPIRTLIRHHLCSIDWLAARMHHKFRLCYRNAEGVVISEAVSAVEVLSRGEELGWSPSEDEPTELGWPWLFREALYHYRNGVHWYSTAFSDTDDMLPLAFPKSVLEKERRRTESRIKRAMSRSQREQSAKRRAIASEVRAGQARIMALAVERMQAEAARNGRPIAASTAKRRAKAWVRQWEEDIVTAMKRINDHFEGTQNGQ